MNGMNPSKGKQSSPIVCSTAQLPLSAAGFAGASSSAWGQRAEGGFLLDSLLPVRSWACQGKNKRAVKAQSYTCLCETPKLLFDIVQSWQSSEVLFGCGLF